MKDKILINNHDSNREINNNWCRCFYEYISNIMFCVLYVLFPLSWIDVWKLWKYAQRKLIENENTKFDFEYFLMFPVTPKRYIVSKSMRFLSDDTFFLKIKYQNSFFLIRFLKENLFHFLKISIFDLQPWSKVMYNNFRILTKVWR